MTNQYSQATSTDLASALSRISELEESLANAQLEVRRYRSIVERQPDAVCLYQNDFTLTYANEAYCNLFKLDKDKVFGCDFLAFIPPEERQAAIANVLALGESHPHSLTDHRSIFPDGTVRWIQWIDSALLDENGKIVGYQAVGRDISDLKALQQALQASAERYRLVVDSITDGLFVSPVNSEEVVPTTPFVEVNEAACQMLGYTREELLGIGLSTVNAPESETDVVGVLRDLLAGKSVTFEQTLVRKDGKRIPVEIHSRCEPLQGVQCILSLVHDISDRKQAEESIRLQSGILQHSQELIGLAEKNGNLIFLNPSGLRMLGYDSSESIVGKHVRIFYTDEDFARLRAEGLPLVYQGHTWRSENRLKRRDGSVIPVEQSIFPILNAAGEMVNIATIITEITQRKQAEDALRASEAKYRSLVESSDSSILMFDSDGRLMFANQIAIDTLKFPPGDNVGRMMHELFSPRAADIQMAFMQNVVRSGVGEVIEMRAPLEDGDRWFRTSVQPVQDGAGHVTGVMVNSVDITHVKEAEEALRRSEHLFQQFMNYTPTLVSIADDSGQLTYCNEQYAQSIGKTQAEIVGKYIDQFLPPETAKLAHLENERVLKARHAFEFMHQSKRNGELRYSLMVKFPILRQNIPPLIGGVALDVTSEKQAEQALVEINEKLEQRVAERTTQLASAHRRLQMVFDHSGDSIVELDQNTAIIQANRTFGEMFGLPVSDILGSKLGNLLPTVDEERFNATLNELAEGHSRRRIEAQAVRTDGSRLDIEISVAALGKDSVPGMEAAANTYANADSLTLDSAVAAEMPATGYVCIIRDISERRQAEQAIAQERNLLRTLIDAVPDSIYVRDCEGRLALSNLAYARSLGYTTPEQIADKTLGELYPETAAAQTLLEDQQILAGESLLLSREECLPGRNGAPERWVVATRLPLWDLQGNILGIVGSSHDITTIKQNEEALRRSEHQLRESRQMLQLVLETIPVSVFWKDRQSVYLGCSRHFAETAGLKSPEEIIGLRDTEFDWLVEGTLYEAADKIVIETGNSLLNYETTLTNTRGETYIHQTSKVPLRDTTGEIIGVLGTAVDITARRNAEKALRKSEERYRSVVTTMAEGVIVVNNKTQIEACNPAACTILGLPTSALIGATPATSEWVGIHEDGSPFPVAEFPVLETLRTGEARIEVVVGMPAFGSVQRPITWLLMNSQPLFEFGSSLPSSAVVTFTDITDRKLAEEALERQHQEERHMRFLLETLHEISIKLARTELLDEFFRNTVALAHERFGFERMCLLLQDATHQTVTGTYRLDMLGNVVSEPQIPVPIDSLPEPLRRALQSNERTWFEENVALYKDADTATPLGKGWMAIAALWDGTDLLGWLIVDNAISKGPASKILRDILALYALTIGSMLARHRSEQALRASEARYHLLVDVASEGLQLTDNTGRIVYINASMTTLAGYSAEEMIGQNYYDFLHPSMVDSTLMRFEQRKQGMRGKRDILFRHKNGSYNWLMSSAAPVFGQDGQFQGVMAMFSDISDRKRYEETLERALAQERELNELKSRFISTASHEFRTPLATIMASVETLVAYRHQLDDKQIDKRLTKIRVQVDLLRNIMDDVLTLARLQTPRAQFLPLAMDFDTFVTDIVEEFQTLPDGKHQFDYKCEPSALRAEVDAKLMRQVLGNLLSNATKYSPDSLTVYVRVWQENDDIVLTVKDNGIGIPPNNLKNLFEAFYRADNVGQIPGTGLGLTVAKQCIELHRGTISVESAPDTGTLFIIRFPIHSVIAAASLKEMGNTNHDQDSAH